MLQGDLSLDKTQVSLKTLVKLFKEGEQVFCLSWEV